MPHETSARRATPLLISSGSNPRHCRRLHTRWAIVCVALLSGSDLAHAQAPPDAGALLKQIEQQRNEPLPQKSEPQFVPPPPMQSLGGTTVTVKTFRFAGNTLLKSEQLARAVGAYTDRPIDFAGLQNAAVAVADVYRKAGWVVRAYLPQQDVTSGAVTIQIVEGRFGSVRVEGRAARISTPRLKSVVESAQRPGTPVSAEALDRALLLIDDLPGVSATGRLTEGRSLAETDLVLAVADRPLIKYDMAADNTGARSTGAARAVAQASLRGPFKLGDRADFLLLHSEGSDYVRAAYSLPAGSQGWRVGVNASHFAYDIVTPEFSALDAHGTSTTAGVEANYPLLRSRLKNLYFTSAVDDRRFDNQSSGQTTTNYTVQTASVGLYGNVFDTLAGGGANSASIALIQGRVDLSGSPNEAADALTTDTAGSFRKLNFSVSREQLLTDRLSLYASLYGQMASKNLDSSEKFYLGGSSGVRAYPANEAGGAEGLLATLEARARLPASFNATGFFDWGSVRVNKNNSIVGAAVPNRDHIEGVGVALGWTASFGLNVRASVAHRLGTNPSPTNTGDDQDGSLIKTRFWLQASLSL